MSKYKVIASPTTWIEGEAVRQLEQVSEFPNMISCVGMPDLHPGKGSPVGAVFQSTEVIYPNLVGSDIGCGMALWSTNISSKNAKVDKIAKKLNGLDEPWDGELDGWLKDKGIGTTLYDSSLGTPGFGNHFIEVQQVETIFDEAYNLTKESLYIMVHSGSRGFGEAILREYTSKFGAKGIIADSPDGEQYLTQHEHAMKWAILNRELCAERVLELLNANGHRILDICHNSVLESTIDGCSCWLHRKGAAPADKGLVVIPGSRGDLSYLVKPKPTNKSLFSLAHGAGRKLSRADAKDKISQIYKKKDIRENKWGGKIVCGDPNLLWEEAPECYKNIASVINDLVEAELLDIIATLRPLVTFKTSEGFEEKVKEDKKKWQKDRRSGRELKEHYR